MNAVGTIADGDDGQLERVVRAPVNDLEGAELRQVGLTAGHLDGELLWLHLLADKNIIKRNGPATEPEYCTKKMIFQT